MAQINTASDLLPHDARIYQYAMVDTPGVVAANNFFSWFNPANSGKVVQPLGLVVQCYSPSNSVSSNSLVLYRTSSESGGSLVAASNITKYNPNDATNPVATIRTSNPTVVTSGIALVGIAPVQSTGGGTVVPVVLAPFGFPPTIPMGTGLVFGTAGGSTSQLWNIQLTWWEFTP